MHTAGSPAVVPLCTQEVHVILQVGGCQVQAGGSGSNHRHNVGSHANNN